MSWNVDAPEFIPGRRFVLPNISSDGSSTRSHATSEETCCMRSRDTTSRDTTSRDTTSSDTTSRDTSSCTYSDVTTQQSQEMPGSSGKLCPYYFETGSCEEGEECVNVHGLLCPHCNRHCLPPGNTQLQQCHKDVCAEIKSFNEAAEASKELSCAICYEIVLEKEEKKERKFGLLSECWHTFCLDCIRRWRSSQTKDQTKRNCPICRKISYFVIPSEVWVSDPAEKDRLVQGYKEHLSTKDCMHFKKGREHCPFGANCFYKHALPDGTIVADNVVKRRINSQGDSVVVTMPLISDFLEELLTYSATSSQHLHNLRSLFHELNNHP